MPGTLQEPSHKEAKSSLKILSAQRGDGVLGSSSSAERQEGRLRSRPVSLCGFRDELSKLMVLDHQDARLCFCLGLGSHGCGIISVR